MVEDSTSKRLTRKYKSISKKEHLENVRSRLNGEVKIIGEYLEEYDKQQMGKDANPIGFYSMIRIIMPIIETVARAQKIKPYDLLGELKVRAPNVTWNLYRHVFLHHDEFVTAATTRGDAIQSGIALINPNTDPEMAEFFAKDGRNANPLLLLDELTKYLDRVIPKTAPEEQVKILETMVFEENTPESAEIKAIVDDIKRANKAAEDARNATAMER